MAEFYEECSNSLKEAIVRLVVTDTQYTSSLLEILVCTCNGEWNDMCIIVFSHAENIPQNLAEILGCCLNRIFMLCKSMYVCSTEAKFVPGFVSEFLK